jgi:Zn-dependent protease with chaperone function
MLFTPGGILTAVVVLQCLLITFLAWKWSVAARAQRPSGVDLAATPPEKVPTRLESRLQELEADQVSLSSSFEKVARDLKRLNSRAGMRELRAESTQERSSAPPLGTNKADLLKYYGMSGKVGPAFAQAQMEFEQRQH